MHTPWLIIDGYSLLHRDAELKPVLRADLMAARQRLVRKIEEVAGALADRITVVFDGKAAGAGEGYESSAVEILFSPANQTADTVIERLVHECSAPEQILVVTSDLAERHTVSAAGAETMSGGDFLDLCEEERRRAARVAGATRRKAPKAKLGDFFPKP
jgi:uncharacterized protein